MRKLTPNEARLLTLLGIVTFLMLNWIGFHWLNERRKEVKRDLQEWSARNTDSERWLNEKTQWDSRAALLNQKQPVLKNHNESSAAFLERLQSSLQKAGLTVDNQEFLSPDPSAARSPSAEKNVALKMYLTPQSSPVARDVGVKLKFNGSHEALIKWLATIQKPDAFIVILTLNVKGHSDPLKIKGEATLLWRHVPEEADRSLTDPGTEKYPQSPAYASYEAMAKKSPFVLASSQEEATVADALVLAGILRMGDQEMVTLKDRQSGQRYLVSKDLKPQGMELVSVTVDPDWIKSTVTINRGDENLVVKYDPGILKEGPGAAAQGDSIPPQPNAPQPQPQVAPVTTAQPQQPPPPNNQPPKRTIQRRIIIPSRPN